METILNSNKINKTASYTLRVVKKYCKELKDKNPEQYKKRAEYFREYQKTKYYYNNTNDFIKCIKKLFE